MKPTSALYPKDARSYSPLFEDEKDFEVSLRDEEETVPNEIFEDNIRVRVTDIDCQTNGRGQDPAPTCTSTLHNTSEGVLSALEDKSKHRIRIISIASFFTLAPLQITASLMRRILLRYDVPADFLQVLFSFGDAPNDVEGSNSHLSISRSLEHSKPSGDDDAFRTCISYQIQYVERNHRPGKGPDWSSRQTGVYHQSTSDGDLFILLHSTPKTKAEERLTNLSSRKESKARFLNELVRNPIRLHNLCFSSYFNNWRWYLRQCSTKFSDVNNPAMAMDFKSLTMTESGNHSFNNIHRLRHIHDQVLLGKACCQGSRQVIKGLLDLNHSDSKATTQLGKDNLRLEGFVNSFESFEKRLQNTIDLLGYAISLKSQLESTQVERKVGESTQEVRDMTSEARDLTQQVRDFARKADRDSSSILFLTLIGAFYLPGSFVATIYGMNFFGYDADKRHITVARNTWIFAATWIPLILLTILSFFALRWLDSWRHTRK